MVRAPRALYPLTDPICDDVRSKVLQILFKGLLALYMLALKLEVTFRI